MFLVGVSRIHVGKTKDRKRQTFARSIKCSNVDERIMTYSFSRKRWVYSTDAILFKIKNLVVSRTNQEATTFKRSESNRGRRKNNGTDDREGKQKDFDNDRPDSIS